MTHRYFPLDPLLKAIGMDASTYQPISGQAGNGLGQRQYHDDLAAIFRVPRQTVEGWLRAERRRLTERNADAAACNAGLHPGDVWPDWW